VESETSNHPGYAGYPSLARRIGSVEVADYQTPVAEPYLETGQRMRQGAMGFERQSLRVLTSSDSDPVAASSFDDPVETKPIGVGPDPIGVALDKWGQVGEES
jgi:hypothetical protein